VKVAVAFEGELATRVRHILETEPDTSVVDATEEDCQAVIGRPGPHGVIADLVAKGPCVYGASPIGLAIAISRRLDHTPSLVAVALPGIPPKTGVEVDFPPPIGRLRADLVPEVPEPVMLARTRGPWSAVLVRAGGWSRLIIDHAEFLRAICLTAGISVLPVDEPTPVWAKAENYLRRAEAMGLVTAAPA
jgi:hypothetical protein